MRASVAAAPPSRSARSSALAVWNTIVRACSVRSVILASWRRISGCSINGRPKATRCRATCIASVSARRIRPAARTPFESREWLTMSAICWKPRPRSPTRHAIAPSRRISPLAIDRVPSLSLSRRIRYAFGVPSGRTRGSRNSDTPRSPGWVSAGSLRASTIAKPASGFEQNHLSPCSAHDPSAPSVARVAVPATSEPAPCSVMNIAPCWSASKSSAVTIGNTRSTRPGSPNRRRVRASESVIDTGQHRPNSACTSR